MQTTLDLYTDYLLSSFGQTTATGLSRLTDGAVGHDAVTDLLNRLQGDNRTLWQHVKPLIRQIQEPDGLLLTDDSIAHKPHSDENGLVTTHYDHTSGQYVRGINFVSLLYQTSQGQCPLSFEPVIKTQQCERKTRQVVWRSERTKHQMFQDMVRQAHQNSVPFRYVLADSWYTNSDNINLVLSLKHHYLGAVKSNLEVALSKHDRANGKFVKISSLKLQPGTVLTVFIRSVASPVAICDDIFPNKDGSVGELHLLTTDVTMTYQQLLTTYQKRWGIEEYHKSLKQNASLEKSPTRTHRTQANHLFASICAYVKLERLRLRSATNHFALKGRLYLKAMQAAFAELNSLKNQLSQKPTMELA
ncbi:IS701 family transposase [Spirosoma pollinicola]|uniref:IS701 family transposase n=2 Tax=Spirosoma pollinicola TaxID=2057025 RepID=A0A2K8Z1M0_9BACT|nr:transposase [Spirosoma pollinicola]AUD03751.1 IS701 family transposase [Spirosoma pollinicola]